MPLLHKGEAVEPDDNHETKVFDGIGWKISGHEIYSCSVSSVHIIYVLSGTIYR